MNYSSHKLYYIILYFVCWFVYYYFFLRGGKGADAQKESFKCFAKGKGAYL